MNDIGILGVGSVGKYFVDRLLTDGSDVAAYDVDEEQLAYVLERGGRRVDSPAALAATTDCVLLALPGSPEVEATMEGEDGLLESLSTGQLVIDASTTLPATSIACQEYCAARGATFLEAPITGGSPREGWHAMVGGTVDAYHAARDVLDVVCEDHVRIGPVGEATIFKLGLQLRYAGRAAIDAEVVAFLRDAGVDPAPLVEFLELDVPERYLSGDYGQAIEGMGGFAIWHKDVGYARAVARENDTALPLAAVVHEAYEDASGRLEANEGHAAALIRYWEALNDDDNR